MMTTQKTVPTAADYEKLARTAILGRGDDPDGLETVLGGETIPSWKLEGLDECSSTVTQTQETLDDFRRASRQWGEPGRMREINGGLYWARCQARKGQPRCELTVVDCGDFRLCYQV